MLMAARYITMKQTQCALLHVFRDAVEVLSCIWKAGGSSTAGRAGAVTMGIGASFWVFGLPTGEAGKWPLLFCIGTANSVWLGAWWRASPTGCLWPCLHQPSQLTAEKNVRKNTEVQLYTVLSQHLLCGASSMLFAGLLSCDTPPGSILSPKLFLLPAAVIQCLHLRPPLKTAVVRELIFLSTDIDQTIIV